MSDERVIFIAGPTASGKSAAALQLAIDIDGEIVNSDAMQVYKDLAVLTARPSDEDEARVPHHLYGYLDGAVSSSAGRWAEDATAAINAINAKNKIAILVGGTGLYFKTLEEGLSPIPDIPISHRDKAKARHLELGADAFRNEVVQQDPGMAHLPAGDTQRLIRAFEVFDATGKPLSHFQNLPRQPLINKPLARVVIEPGRETLYTQCEMRAAAMLDGGGIDEVKTMMARALDPALPLMKALGAPEIMAHLKGVASREDTLAQLQQNTRRFAKRQLTWFRNQASCWPRASTAASAVAILKQQLGAATTS